VSCRLYIALCVVGSVSGVIGLMMMNGPRIVLLYRAEFLTLGNTIGLPVMAQGVEETRYRS